MKVFRALFCTLKNVKALICLHPRKTGVFLCVFVTNAVLFFVIMPKIRGISDFVFLFWRQELCKFSLFAGKNMLYLVIEKRFQLEK